MHAGVYRIGSEMSEMMDEHAVTAGHLTATGPTAAAGHPATTEHAMTAGQAAATGHTTATGPAAAAGHAMTAGYPMGAGRAMVIGPDRVAVRAAGDGVGAGHGAMHACRFILSRAVPGIGPVPVARVEAESDPLIRLRAGLLRSHRERPPPWTVPSLAELSILRI